MTVQTNVKLLRSDSPDETERLASEFGAELAPGDVVLLVGELGSGKTTFVRGAARALGVEGRVTSPTFAIGNVYAAHDLTVTHVDLYRLDSISLTDEAVLDDYVGPRTITFVEWPHDELEALDDVRAVVALEHAGGDARTIRIAWRDRASGGGAG